jgi:protein SCO1/2
MRPNLTVLSSLLLVAQLAFSAPTNAPTQIHETRGLVREIAADRTTAVIRHEEIPGYMPPMTMELNVRDTNELTGIVAGDTVTFRLLATDDTHWIDRVKKVAGATNTAPPELPAGIIAVKELLPGDAMPDARFLDEHGRTIRFADFKGQALAFTFFFTRCPLPDYCPLMNKHFSAARRQLITDTNAPANWSLLCISFDSEFDKPAVLAGYARTYRGDDTNRWLFASASAATLKTLAPQLDLVVQADGPGFSHNLRTVVLDTRGRIHRQFDGNRWTADDLAKALREAAQVPVKAD